MTPNRFNEIVVNRAKERVKAKVAKFEATIAKAFKDLHPCLATSNYYNRWSSGPQAKHAVAVMRLLCGVKEEKNKPVGYPEALWRDEEKAVQEELLATMDEMAKALLAPIDDEPSPIAKYDPTPDDSFRPSSV
jgi:hypothetical protein